VIRAELDLEWLARFVDERIAAHASTGWVLRSACGVERKTVDGWIASGEVASSRVGRQVLVRVADVAKAIEARRIEHKADEDEVDVALRRRHLRAVR
jgi:excisionase family DNA binding protein